MTIKRKAAVVLAGVGLLALWFVFLAGAVDYPDTDVRDLDRDRLFLQTEQLLRESEAWPPDLTADSVIVASSLEPYPVRTVRYSVEVDADLGKVIEYVKDENYSGKTRREKVDKYEDTLYEEGDDAGPHEWVRRSVHIAPPPAGNRDAVVVYFEDRPDPKTYRIAFQSVETIDGKEFPEVEDAVRFKVLPSIYKVEETAPGKVRIRKVEAVDPRGSMSTLMNNYFISLIFFRNYMFEQAKQMRETLHEGQG
jgi:START domain